MKTKTIQVTVTGDKAILCKGSIAEISFQGANLWLVVKSNGHSVYPMSLFLVAGRDFQVGGVL